MKLIKRANNFHEVRLPNNKAVWFSYETTVACTSDGLGLVILDYTGSTQTGKHLNMLNRDKSVRVSKQRFEAILETHFGDM